MPRLTRRVFNCVQSAVITPAVCVIACQTAISSLAAGQSVGPQIRLDVSAGPVRSNETTGAASDANPLEIIAGWNDYRNFGFINSGFALSLDAGDTWTDFLIRPPVANQTSVEGDPMTAFDPRTGTLWAGAIAFGGNGGVYVARKDPGDPAFQPTVMADTTGGADKCWMAAGPRHDDPDSTRVYIAYNLGVIWSDDMGTTWTNPVSIGGGIGYLPRVGPNGELYVLYWDFSSQHILARSVDGGATFTTHTVATRMDVWGTQDGSRFPGQFRVPSLAYFDVDPATGTLYATYFDTTNFVDGDANVDLYITTSNDLGTTWSTPSILPTGDGTPNTGDQFWNWIEIDAAGNLHTVYLDTRHTAQDDNLADGMFDAYHAISQDGGATWSEFRLTPDSWNSADFGGSSQFLGDYMGIATAGNRAFPIYVDTSNGHADVYTNVVQTSVPGDTDGDGIVNIVDLLNVLSGWGPCPGCPGDVNQDGFVNILDLLIVLSGWTM